MSSSPSFVGGSAGGSAGGARAQRGPAARAGAAAQAAVLNASRGVTHTVIEAVVTLLLLAAYRVRGEWRVRSAGMRAWALLAWRANTPLLALATLALPEAVRGTPAEGGNALTFTGGEIREGTEAAARGAGGGAGSRRVATLAARIRPLFRHTGRSSVRPRQLSDRKVCALQRRILATVLSRRLGIGASRRDIEILARFANLPWVLSGLYRAAGYSRVRPATGNVRRRLEVVLPIYASSLAVRGAYLALGTQPKDDPFTLLYPRELSQREREVARCARQATRKRRIRSYQNREELRRLEAHLTALTLIGAGRIRTTERAERLLRELERIY
ncbi:MAG: hypothetical protein ACLFP6_11595 [Spirochaetaceae bacterium]